tara:strand:- start:569 stop:733 length:165 start_codon:yes stop_codon:yes gene_type:complete
MKPKRSTKINILICCFRYEYIRYTIRDGVFGDIEMILSSDRGLFGYVKVIDFII